MTFRAVPLDDVALLRLLNEVEHLISSDPGEVLPLNWWTIKVFDPN